MELELIIACVSSAANGCRSFSRIRLRCSSSPAAACHFGMSPLQSPSSPSQPTSPGALNTATTGASQPAGQQCSFWRMSAALTFRQSVLNDSSFDGIQCDASIRQIFLIISSALHRMRAKPVRTKVERKSCISCLGKATHHKKP